MREKFEKSKLIGSLNEVGFVGELHWLDEVDSTNLFASELLKNGVSAPFLVVARKQTAGKGRLTRKWISETDSTLCMSIALNLPNDTKLLSSFTTRASSSICLALEKEFGAKIFIKWPNDIYSARGGKIAGMLTELRISANGRKTAIFGVGVNCFPLSSATEQDFPCDALCDFCDFQISLQSVAAQIAKSAYMASVETSSSNLPERFSKFDWLKSKEISLDVGGEILRGVANGIADTGELLLRLDSGDVRPIAALEATILKSDTVVVVKNPKKK